MKKEGVMLPVQEHHDENARKALKCYGGDPRLAAFKETMRLRDMGYSNGREETDRLYSEFRFAFGKHVEGQTRVVEDGQPDAYCMGCFKDDCVLAERRDNARGTWRAMRQQIWGK